MTTTTHQMKQDVVNRLNDKDSYIKSLRDEQSEIDRQREQQKDAYYKELSFNLKMASRLPMSSKYNKHNRASLYNIITADEMASGFGDSEYDKNARFLSDIYDPTNLRAREQSGFAQIAAGFGKFVGYAATTFLDNTVGDIVGIFNGAFGKEDFVTGFVNNPFSRAMLDIQKGLDEAMPNYRTHEEQGTPWYRRLGTANLWGDEVLKNLGFTVGAALGAIVGSKGVGLALKGAGKLLMRKSLKTLAKAGISLEDGMKNEKYIQELTSKLKAGTLTESDRAFMRLSKDYSRRAGMTSVVSSIAGATGEARMEALNGLEEYITDQTNALKEWYANNPDALIDMYENATKNGYQGDFETFKQQTFNEEIKRINSSATELANEIFGLQTCLLSATNFSTFGRVFSGGYNSAKSSARQFWSRIGRDEQGQLTRTGDGLKRVAAFRSLVVEGPVEEMGQYAITEFSKERKGSKRNAEFGYQYNNKYNKEVTDLLNAWRLAFKRSYGNAEAWEEGAIGALFGGFGMVGPVNKSSKELEEEYKNAKTDEEKAKIKKRKFGFMGGVLGELRDLRLENEEVDNIIENYKKYADSDKVKGVFRALSLQMAGEDIKKTAVAADDKKMYLDGDFTQVLGIADAYYRAGQMDELNELFDDVIQSTKDFQEGKLNENDRNDLLTLIGNISGINLEQMSEKQINEKVASIGEHAEELKRQVNSYVEVSENIKNAYSDVWDAAALDYMSKRYATARNRAVRANEIINNKDTREILNQLFNDEEKEAFNIKDETKRNEKIFEILNEKFGFNDISNSRSYMEQNNNMMKSYKKIYDAIKPTSLLNSFAKGDNSVYTRIDEIAKDLVDAYRNDQEAKVLIREFLDYSASKSGVNTKVNEEIKDVKSEELEKSIIEAINNLNEIASIDDKTYKDLLDTLKSLNEDTLEELKGLYQYASDDDVAASKIKKALGYLDDYKLISNELDAYISRLNAGNQLDSNVISYLEHFKNIFDSLGYSDDIIGDFRAAIGDILNPNDPVGISAAYKMDELITATVGYKQHTGRIGAAAATNGAAQSVQNNSTGKQVTMDRTTMNTRFEGLVKTVFMPFIRRFADPSNGGDANYLEYILSDEYLENTAKWAAIGDNVNKKATMLQFHIGGLSPILFGIKQKEKERAIEPMAKLKYRFDTNSIELSIWFKIGTKHYFDERVTIQLGEVTDMLTLDFDKVKDQAVEYVRKFQFSPNVAEFFEDGKINDNMANGVSELFKNRTDKRTKQTISPIVRNIFLNKGCFIQDKTINPDDNMTAKQKEDAVNKFLQDLVAVTPKRTDKPQEKKKDTFVYESAPNVINPIRLKQEVFDEAAAAQEKNASILKEYEERVNKETDESLQDEIIDEMKEKLNLPIYLTVVDGFDGKAFHFSIEPLKGLGNTIKFETLNKMKSSFKPGDYVSFINESRSYFCKVTKVDDNGKIIEAVDIDDNRTIVKDGKVLSTNEILNLKFPSNTATQKEAVVDTKPQEEKPIEQDNDAFIDEDGEIQKPKSESQNESIDNSVGDKLEDVITIPSEFDYDTEHAPQTTNSKNFFTRNGLGQTYESVRNYLISKGAYRAISLGQIKDGAKVVFAEITEQLENSEAVKIELGKADIKNKEIIGVFIENEDGSRGQIVGVVHRNKIINSDKKYTIKINTSNSKHLWNDEKGNTHLLNECDGFDPNKTLKEQKIGMFFIATENDKPVIYDNGLLTEEEKRIIISNTASTWTEGDNKWFPGKMYRVLRDAKGQLERIVAVETTKTIAQVLDKNSNDTKEIANRINGLLNDAAQSIARGDIDRADEIINQLLFRYDENPQDDNRRLYAHVHRGNGKHSNKVFIDMYDPAAGFSDKIEHPKLGRYKVGRFAGQEMSKMLSIDLNLISNDANTISNVASAILAELKEFVNDSDATFNINSTTLAGKEKRSPNEPDHITIDELAQGNCVYDFYYSIGPNNTKVSLEEHDMTEDGRRSNEAKNQDREEQRRNNITEAIMPREEVKREEVTPEEKSDKQAEKEQKEEIKQDGIEQNGVKNVPTNEMSEEEKNNNVLSRDEIIERRTEQIVDLLNSVSPNDVNANTHIFIMYNKDLEKITIRDFVKESKYESFMFTDSEAIEANSEELGVKGRISDEIVSEIRKIINNDRLHPNELYEEQC